MNILHLEPLPSGLVFQKRISAALDIVHIFIHSRVDLLEILESLRHTIKPDRVV